MSDKKTNETEAAPETVPLSSSGDGETEPTPLDEAEKAAEKVAESAARQALPIPGMPLSAPVPVVDEED